MADSAAFDFVCSQLEERTELDRLAARGTVRLALKQAGLDPHAVTPDQMAVVVDKLLPAELETRGIGDGPALCASLVTGVRALSTADEPETPDAVFQRLGGS